LIKGRSDPPEIQLGGNLVLYGDCLITAHEIARLQPGGTYVGTRTGKKKNHIVMQIGFYETVILSGAALQA
jgi:hypothetical protein